MPSWKLRIFVRAITTRMLAEEITAEVALQDYITLTVTERQSILESIALQ